MSYKIIVVGSDNSARVIADVEAGLLSEVEAFVARLNGPRFFARGETPNGNSRAVYVESAEDDNGFSYRRGDTFPSAIAASKALGFPTNVVGDRLAKAKRLHNDDVVTLKGLTLRYVDTLRV